MHEVETRRLKESKSRIRRVSNKLGSSPSPGNAPINPRESRRQTNASADITSNTKNRAAGADEGAFAAGRATRRDADVVRVQNLVPNRVVRLPGLLAERKVKT